MLLRTEKYPGFGFAVLAPHFYLQDCKERLGNPRGRDLAMVRTLALCRDAIAHANESLASGEPCRLLLFDTHHGDTPRLLFIYKRWIPSIFTIED
uniref:Uncharacterized protein n=1 Tax=Nelumbo nucifera TaxID=4432 RepID=A0A822YSA4_NELNU|nr:TPA_asm: hypothetical protein HUJ06_006047 [Nelumbo nucifera]